MTPIVKWSNVKRVSSKKSPNYWKLYLTKTFYIIRSLNNKNLLNKRPELVNKFLHEFTILYIYNFTISFYIYIYIYIYVYIGAVVLSYGISLFCICFQPGLKLIFSSNSIWFRWKIFQTCSLKTRESGGFQRFWQAGLKCVWK